MKKKDLLATTALFITLISGSALASGSHEDSGHSGMNHNMASQNQMNIQAMGKLNSINIKKNKVNISHGPISALNWPPMRMDFSVKKGVSLSNLKKGQKVHFFLMKQGEYEYVISKIMPM
jgi:Cu/Ag efflux protein CusF